MVGISVWLMMGRDSDLRLRETIFRCQFGKLHETYYELASYGSGVEECRRGGDAVGEGGGVGGA
jgi:hypothetical protein